jgi:hypothetical protein
MNKAHTAKYLLLMGSKSAPRALLFSVDHRYLAELIDDDGSMIDNLLRTGTPCAAPHNLALDSVNPAPSTQPESVQCFALS